MNIPPSYTVLHLEDGVDIIVYSRTHVTDITKMRRNLHKNNAIRLQVPKNMRILINPELYYADAKLSFLSETMMIMIVSNAMFIQSYMQHFTQRKIQTKEINNSLVK